MSKIDLRPMGGLIALVLAMAACGGLAGCAGSGERLPECRGRSVPINSLIPAAASTAHVSEVDAR